MREVHSELEQVRREEQALKKPSGDVTPTNSYNRGSFDSRKYLSDFVREI